MDMGKQQVIKQISYKLDSPGSIGEYIVEFIRGILWFDNCKYIVCVHSNKYLKNKQVFCQGTCLFSDICYYAHILCSMYVLTFREDREKTMITQPNFI